MPELPSVSFAVEQIALFLFIASPSLAFALAYVADGGVPALRLAIYGGLVLLALGGLAVGALFALAAVLDTAPANLQPALLWLGDLTIALAAIGILLLIPAVRRGIARFLPIDPVRLVHVLALECVVVALWFSGAVALLLPAMIADPAGLKQMGDATARAGLTGVWVQNAAFVVLSFAGVGLFVHRDWGAALERLGLRQRISWRWWIGGAAAALVIMVATDQLWTMADPEGAAALGKLSDQLFGPLIAKGGLAAALTIGLAPGIGEELIFRGAAQPRLGLVMTALLFAAVHTQYTVSWALVQILIVGLILGTVRNRAGTGTAVLVHATFNAAQVLLSVYG